MTRLAKPSEFRQDLPQISSGTVEALAQNSAGKSIEDAGSFGPFFATTSSYT